VNFTSTSSHSVLSVEQAVPETESNAVTSLGKVLAFGVSGNGLAALSCRRVGLEGVSTHSFRRTALTQMCNAGIPLRHIQEISGHNDLGTLQRYLEVSPDQRRKASEAIGF